MSWEAVYDIASKRHHTKMGKDHLPERALYVLQVFVNQERQLAMQKAVTGMVMQRIDFDEMDDDDEIDLI